MRRGVMLSAEVRWFWPNAPPVAFEAWFGAGARHHMVAAGRDARCDQYLKLSEPLELGIKKRGSAGVEIKGLIARHDRSVKFASLAASVEIWGKWTATTLDLTGMPLLAVSKRRWIRKFVPAAGEMREVPETNAATPGPDCEVELTRLTAPDGAKWWTLGFEAHGTLEDIEATLMDTVAVLDSRLVPPLAPGQAANYPAWLSSQPW